MNDNAHNVALAKTQLESTTTVYFNCVESQAMLNDVDRHLLNEVACRRAQPGSPTFFDAVEAAYDLLPKRAVIVLSQLKKGLLDAAVFRGFPHDDSPVRYRETETLSGFPLLGYSWLAAVARRLGYEYSYEAEKAGALVHDVLPTVDRMQSQSNASSSMTLLLHTEIAFHSIRPDFIILYCVQAGGSPAATNIAHIDNIITSVPGDALDVLMQRRFKIHAPESFLLEGIADDTVMISPLGGNNKRRTVRWHESICGIDHVAALTVVPFIKSALSVTMKISLKPGDMLVFANDRFLHGRDRFAARFDESDRWLLRTYVLRDITRISSRSLPDATWTVAV